MAGKNDFVLSATDETAAAFNSFNNRLKEVAKNTDVVAKASKVGFALFVGGEILGGIRALGKEMFNVANATNKIDAQRLQGMHNSMDKAKASFMNVAAVIGSKLAPILQMAADWFVKLMGNGDGFRDKFGAVFAALTRAVGVFADGWRGIEVIWDVLKVAFHGFRLAVMTGLSEIDVILTDVANKIPGVHMQYSAGLAGATKSAREAVDGAKQDLAELMGKPLPSTMMMDAVKQFDTMTGAAVKLTKEQEKARKAAADAMAKAKEEQSKFLDDIVNSGTERIAKENEALTTGMENLRRAGLTKMQILEEQHAAELESIQSARVRNLTDEDTARQLELESLARFNEQKAAIQKEAADKAQATRVAELGQFQWMSTVAAGFEQKTLKGRILASASLFGQLSGLMQSDKKKEFEIGKKAAIANSLISMYEGIGKAWHFGPILGPIFAALVGTAGMMNIRQIQSQQFQGGGAANVGATPTMSVGSTGLPDTGGAGPFGEAPSLPMSSSSSAPQKNVTFVVESGNAMLDLWVREKLAPTMREAYGDGVKFLTA